MNLSSLKKTNSLDKLKSAMESASKPSGASSKDDRFWQPDVDKAGNGYAVIRFLDAPAVDGEDGLPWVQVWSHGFQGPGGWYIENSLTTIGQTDPVSEYNTQLWNSGVESNKAIARNQKRKLTYISNIMVISDPKHPENEGGVFLYKFGKKIFDKIQEKLNPQFEDEKPLNPFDFWKGANFKVKIRQVEGYRNYDKSEFDVQSAILDGEDDKIEKIWKKAYSLKEFLAPKNFKSYDELKTKLDRVLGAGGTAGRMAPAIDEDSAPWEEPKSVAPRATAESITTDDDDDLSYFKNLADD
jgi:hypothetical protein